TSALSMMMQKKINPDAPNMAGMMLTMPLISLFIGFTLPGGVTFYWTCSSLIGGLIQIAVQQFYGPHKMLSRERLKELNKECDFEQTQIKKINQAKLNGETAE
ncbi:MAG: YidC/Oxa1 family membrane protein insertase, partial [Acutalibacteraceae bacterium]